MSDESAGKLINQANQLVLVLDMKLADHSRHQEMIRSIQWALLRGKQLSGQYESPYQDKTERVTLHPYRLCLIRQAWYLVARPAKEDRPKTYRAIRFKTLRMLDDDATAPDDFSVGDYFGNAWGVFRGKDSHDVELHFNKKAASIVTETRWHHTQQVTRNRNGTATLKFKVDGLDEIVWWLLAWAGFVEVVKPVKLREMLSEQLRAGLKMNEDS